MTEGREFRRHRRQFPVEARQLTDGSWLTPGLSFEDYGGMQMQHRKSASYERRLDTPLWALNNRMLRELVVTFMEERAGFRKPQTGGMRGTLPPALVDPIAIALENERLDTELLRERLARAQAAIIDQRPRLQAVMEKLCKAYVEIKTKGLDPSITDDEWNRTRLQPYMTRDDPDAEMVFEPRAQLDDEETRKKILTVEIEGIDTYLRITKSGGADIIAAIVYLYYRTDLDSVGVGNELGLKPPHVRQTLWRLHETWNAKLAQKVYATHHPCSGGGTTGGHASPLFGTL